MNNLTFKRAVCYVLLIVCLAAAIPAVLLPFAYKLEAHSFADFLIPVSVLRYVNLDASVVLAGVADEGILRILNALLLVFACVTVLELIRALLRVLQGMAQKPETASALGKGPLVGICYFALLLILGGVHQVRSLNTLLDHGAYFQPLWPLAGLLLNLAALRLSRVLNPRRPGPASESEIKKF